MKNDFTKHGPHVAAMMAMEGWRDEDISADRKPVINMAKKLYDIGKRIEDTLHKEKVPGKYRMEQVDTKRQKIEFFMRGTEAGTHAAADALVEDMFGPENIHCKVFPIDHEEDMGKVYSAKHVYTVGRFLVKMNELPGDDVDELEVLDEDFDSGLNGPEKFLDIPLGLNANEDMTQLANPDAKPGICPKSILEDLEGQLSDGKWENTPAMEKYWLFMEIGEKNGELTLHTSVKPKPYMAKFVYNGFLDKLGGVPGKIREWLAKHLKILVQDEVGSEGWKRDNEQPLSSFNDGTTVAMVYAVYDILKDRPARGKSIYYDAFQA